MPEKAVLTTELRVDDQLSGKLGLAKTQLTQLDATAQKTGLSIGSMAKAGAAAFGAFKALDIATDFLSSGIKGAIEEEATIGRLTASLKANVDTRLVDIAAIERTIAARTALGFTDDEQRASLGSLVAATHDVNSALAIQATAMDLARFKKIDLATATDALIKVESGQFKLLKSLGIELKDGATQTEALAAVQKVAAGQAQTFGNTTAGALRNADVAVGEFTESFGKHLMPVIKGGADFLRTDVIPTLTGVAGGIGLIGDAARSAIDPVTDFIDSLTPDDVGFRWQDLFAPENRPKGIPELTQEFIDLRNAAASLATARSGIETLNSVATGFVQVETDADKLTAALARGRGAFDELGTGAVSATGEVADLTTGVGALTQALLDIPANVSATVTITRHFNDEGDKPSQSGRTQDFDPTHPGGSPAGLHGAAAAAAAAAEEARLKAIRDSEIAADKRLADAKQRANEEARAYETALGKAFDNAKTRANSLFDTLHNRHVQAIRDAETLADRQHAGALELIADTLKAQQLVNAGPVTAAQAALNDRQSSQSRRGLVESLSAAQLAVQENRDPKAADDLNRALRNATEALENFDDAAKIARLTEVQATEDRKAGLVASAKTLAADAALSAAKAQAQKDLDAETISARKRKKDFEADLTKLQAADLKAKKSPAEVQADIKKLEERSGITTDKFGFHHITDPLERAIKNIKIAPPVVHNYFNPTIRVSVGARDVAAAIASQSSPTSTPMVRTGAAGRG